MSLRDEIAKAVQRGIAETPAEYAAPPSVSCLWAADAVLAVLREGEWFDEAVERMCDALGGLEGPMADERVMAVLLNAAIGGEGL